MNTIDDMQNEKNFYDHYNEFEYNHDFVIFLWKIVYAKEVHLIWDDIVYLYLIDYYNFFVSLFIWLNIKPLSRAIVNFLFNSNIRMHLSEITKLFVSLLPIFVKFKSYSHMWSNVWNYLIWQSLLELPIRESIFWMGGLSNSYSLTITFSFNTPFIYKRVIYWNKKIFSIIKWSNSLRKTVWFVIGLIVFNHILTLEF